ncbi:hypothetical protein L3X38_001785 [Prunus dulcis]|uniref:Uncharacterized protein n=1 Tax=Prunus dulcis TaxID=3755 RepID=A0AAD4WT69_PRUDU|nr:hypothetical protein L3X38_001785 [Prunus dulcis]
MKNWWARKRIFSKPPLPKGKSHTEAEACSRAPFSPFRTLDESPWAKTHSHAQTQEAQVETLFRQPKQQPRLADSHLDPLPKVPKVLQTPKVLTFFSAEDPILL